MSDLANMPPSRDPEKIATARALSATSQAAAARAAGQATQVALTLFEFVAQGLPLDSPALQRELDAWRPLYDEAVATNRAAIAAWDEATPRSQAEVAP